MHSTKGALKKEEILILQSQITKSFFFCLELTAGDGGLTKWPQSLDVWNEDVFTTLRTGEANIWNFDSIAVESMSGHESLRGSTASFCKWLPLNPLHLVQTTERPTLGIIRFWAKGSFRKPTGLQKKKKRSKLQFKKIIRKGEKMSTISQNTEKKKLLSNFSGKSLHYSLILSSSGWLLLLVGK